MKQGDVKNINFLVDNEEDLYNPLSPDCDFNPAVKVYIKSKCTNVKYNDSIGLTVMHSVPIDEDRFRTAVANWIQEEKSTFLQESSVSNHLLVGMLIIASVFIMLSLTLEKHFDVLTYTIIPVLGSVALGRAAGIVIADLPINNARKKLIERMERENNIVFKQIEKNQD